MHATAHVETLSLRTSGRGFYEFTAQLAALLHRTRLIEGICSLSVMHTSASLIIFENADPTAKSDIEAWMRKHVPDGDPAYIHSDEGPDDMPSHIRAALTATTLTIPVKDSRLMLGRWQGVYLWEHRLAAHERAVAVACVGSLKPINI